MTQRACIVAAVLSTIVPLRGEADPIALRAPTPERVISATLGAPELSLAWWPTTRLGVALEWRLPVASVGASLGTRYLLLGETKGWGVDLHVAGGISVPLGAPAAALTGTAGIAGRWRNEHFHLSVLAVSPVVVRIFPDPTFRLPIAFELWFTVRIARLHLGAQASAGNTFVPGLSWSSAFQASAFLGWSL